MTSKAGQDSIVSVSHITNIDKESTEDFPNHDV